MAPDHLSDMEQSEPEPDDPFFEVQEKFEDEILDKNDEQNSKIDENSRKSTRSEQKFKNSDEIFDPKMVEQKRIRKKMLKEAKKEKAKMKEKENKGIKQQKLDLVESEIQKSAKNAQKLVETSKIDEKIETERIIPQLKISKNNDGENSKVKSKKVGCINLLLQAGITNLEGINALRIDNKNILF